MGDYSPVPLAQQPSSGKDPATRVRAAQARPAAHPAATSVFTGR